MRKSLLLFAAIVLCNTAFGKDKKPIEIGYYVFVQKCDNIYRTETKSIESVYAFIKLEYPDFCADLEYILERSPYFREECYKRKIYVEKMKVTKSGKLKRLKNSEL